MLLLEPIAPPIFRTPPFFWVGVRICPWLPSPKKNKAFVRGEGTMVIYSWWFFTNPFEKYAQVNLDHFPRQGVKIKIFETTTQWFMTRFIMKPYFWEGFPCTVTRPIHLTLHGDVLYWKMGPAVKIPGKTNGWNPQKRRFAVDGVSFSFLGDFQIVVYVGESRMENYNAMTKQITESWYKLLAAQTKSWYFGDPSTSLPLTYKTRSTTRKSSSLHICQKEIEWTSRPNLSW